MRRNQFAGRCGCGKQVRPRKGWLCINSAGHNALRCEECQAAHAPAVTPRLPYKDD